jgi:tetratricopeptide (TPR) repeat protein
MTNDTGIKAEELFNKGIELLGKGESLSALSCFEKSFEIKKTVQCQSYLGMLIALERGKVKEAIALCEDAVLKEPDNTVFYLNLGKVLLKAGRKKEAIETVRKGLSFGENEEASLWLSGLGIRKKPVFSFLPRKNFLNKYAGLILKKLGLR